ncbi:HAMP domain-containing sensor histidine kinase [Pedobacter sp. P351]|uniref:sensor histidine kinase n=1 Tax=Pedobacter superstes TaxID=3133441 RepID=UPI003095213B
MGSFKAYYYRKNHLLNASFLVLITISLIIALVLARNFTEKYVENEFNTQKISVLEETVKPYNDFFLNKIPEISFYQGYLDSASVVKYSDTVLRKYPFVSRIIFFDTQVSNHSIPNAFRINNFSIVPKAVYQLGRDVPADSVLLYKSPDKIPSNRAMDEFNRMASKFSAYVETIDTTKSLSENNLFEVYYNITHNRITFMNNPRNEELQIFRDLINKDQGPSPIYEQDILSFRLNPYKLSIKNNHPELYQEINIQPIVFESVDTDPDLMNTDLALSGAFADYKLFFSSSRSFLSREITRRFMPVAFSILIIYGILGFIAYLIYRNLNINSRMFKLQYDFINNFTHEFKTPLSVIKIAGNNIRSANKISDQERFRYGKILDEEADKLNDLMNKLLSFTQIENQSIQIKNEDINLEVFVQNLIDAYQIKYPDYQITYNIRKVENFRSDPVLMSSIFQNLIENAYKYSLPKQKELHIDISLERGKIVLRFADQGIGIAKEEMENIFRKFYRIQSQYNQQGSVGLGLAFCKELVNFMKGDIFVKSKVGIGSEFTIVLPYEP